MASLLGIHASRAQADEEPEALIRQGVEMRRRGEDAKAHGYFKRAYDIAHTPRSAAQLGLVEQALNHYLDAEQHLSEALASTDAWVDQNRPVLEESRKAVRGELGKVELGGLPPDATLTIAGRPPLRAPPDGIIWVLPGETALRIVAPNHEAVIRTAVVSAGATVAIDVAAHEESPAPPTTSHGGILAATPPPAPPANVLQSNGAPGEQSPPVWRRWWFWTAVGAVVVAGAVTAVLLLRKDSTCGSGEACSTL